MENHTSYTEKAKNPLLQRPITNLDTMGVFMHVFFPEISHSTGDNILNEDPNEISEKV
jgi:hypothetical protein